MTANAPPPNLRALLAEAVKGSGFPLQAKLQSIMLTVPGWEVVGTERPWRHESREEFLDIVARKNNLHLAIECKKSGVLAEKRTHHGLEWFAGAPKRAYVFLRTALDDLSVEQTGLTVCTAFHEPREEDEPDAPEGTHGDLWNLSPISYEASLCVTVDAENPRDMLEWEVSTLVRGTHQYADAMFRYLHGEGAQINEMFVPVYVTTAPIYTSRLDVDEVPVETGAFRMNPEDLEQVPWIRFTKAFMAEGNSTGDDRTVFVVEAKHFKQFLEQFNVLPSKGRPRRKRRPT